MGLPEKWPASPTTGRPVSLKRVAIETFGSRAALSFDFVGCCEKLSNIDGRRRRCGKRMIVLATLTIRRWRSRGSRIGWRRCMARRSEEHTSELQSLMRISYAVFCLKTKTTQDACQNLLHLTQ